MIVYKDCEDYYLYGDNLPDLACVMAENDGIDHEDAGIVVMWCPGSAKNQEINEEICEWMFDQIQEEQEA